MIVLRPAAIQPGTAPALTAGMRVMALGHPWEIQFRWAKTEGSADSRPRARLTWFSFDGCATDIRDLSDEERDAVEAEAQRLQDDLDDAASKLPPVEEPAVITELAPKKYQRVPAVA